MRKRRQYGKTGFYHVIIRGVNKQNIFNDEQDRKTYFLLIKKYSEKFEIKIHAYCLMENHVHLLVEDKNKNLSIFMQCSASTYARYYNRKYDRIGHLFQERFKSEIIKDLNYFKTVFRYIIQNPEKAGICDALSYPWSSKSYFQKTEQDSLIYSNFIKILFRDEISFITFISQNNNDICMETDLRPSERAAYYVDRIKNILQTNNPIITPDLPRSLLLDKIHLLRKEGISIRTISRITGIETWLIQQAK